VFDHAIDTKKEVTHIFTHIRLYLHIYVIHCEQTIIEDGFFVLPSDFKNYAFSTLMKKVWQKNTAT